MRNTIKILKKIKAIRKSTFFLNKRINYNKNKNQF